VQPQPLSLDEKCKKLAKTSQRVVTNTIGYTRKQANKDCAMVNEEKNVARERAIKTKTRGAKNAYELARTKERVCSEKGKAARRRGFNRD
jgi:hypothetical protein